MSLAITSSLFSLNQEDFFFVAKEKDKPSVFSSIASHALDACVAIAKVSSVSEPHFLWADYTSVEVTPSDYQFRWLENSFDLVTIEEEDTPLQAFCIDAVNSLDHYRTLEAGWDGEDMPAPEPASIDDAYNFIQVVSSQLETCPKIHPMLDHEGITSLVFENQEMYCSVAFYGNLEIVTYTLHRRKNESFTATFTMDDKEKLENLLEFFQQL
jgi:hypothetical protein